MDYPQALPRPSNLSSLVVSFLNAKLGTREDLAQAPNLVYELQTQCKDLDLSLVGLNGRLESRLAAYSSFSDHIDGVFFDVSTKLTDLRSSICSPDSVSDGRGLGEELPVLAKEVARVETVRAYAETALKLDNLVGDIEDAVSSAMTKNLRKRSSINDSEEMRLVAIKTFKIVEDILTSVTQTRPQWARLVSAVDHRVDRALAILRPQAIADHRSLLASLGWPPPLSNLTPSIPDAKKRSEVTNPLFTVQGDLKDQYCDSFLALCNLQELQRRRKSRQLEGHNREVALRQPLWVIEELVNPISVASQQHFLKWIDKPEFTFALVYKITRDYVDSMDELLQPLVDKAMLTGYSCREEWISAMVSSLSTYLAKEIFPTYVNQLNEVGAPGITTQARISWLHLVDLMFSFDKRIRSLVERSGILQSLQEDGTLEKISSLAIFSDRPDWLDLWAGIELADALEKLQPKIDDERNWNKKFQGQPLSVSDNFKSPAISSIARRSLQSMVERCRLLPTICLRARFLRLTAAPLVQKFQDVLLLRCQEAEGLTALTDNNALIKVSNSINASRYIESVLKEWCEDVFFLELGLFDDDQPGIPIAETSSSNFRVEGYGGGIFSDEIAKLEAFRTIWVEEIHVVVLRGFDAQCRDYMKNRRQWQEMSGDGGTVTKTLVGALDNLLGKLSIIEENLNGIDFVTVWRSLAAGVDKLIFNGILISNVKFSDDGVERLGHDLDVLFGVFRAWCMRPEGFFPKSNAGLKLLKMGEKQLHGFSVGGETWMKENGIRHLSSAEVEKIAKKKVSKY